MPNVAPDRLRKIAADIFEAANVPAEEAQIISESL